MNQGNERDFERARELLRANDPLSGFQLEELEVLFQEVNGTQFMALTSDPAHTRALKQYGRYVRRRSVPVMTFLFVLFLLSVMVGAAIVLSQ